MTLQTRLVDIAKYGGRRSIIDTPYEIGLAKREIDLELSTLTALYFERCVGEDASDLYRDIEILRDAIYVLENNLSNRFQINLGQARMFPACKFTSSRDCFRLMIPLEDQVFAVFPIYSGANPNDYLDYHVLSNSEWAEMITPLRSKNSKYERSKLAKVVDAFNERFALEDKAGPFGNFFGSRGQQDCVDESYSLFGFLHMLTEEHVLKYHRFNANNMMVGMSFVHFSARIEGPNGSYVVDPWKGETEIIKQSRFEHNLKIQIHQMRGSKI